jgi:hypothetical protein
MVRAAPSGTMTKGARPRLQADRDDCGARLRISCDQAAAETSRPARTKPYRWGEPQRLAGPHRWSGERGGVAGTGARAAASDWPPPGRFEPATVASGPLLLKGSRKPATPEGHNVASLGQWAT